MKKQIIITIAVFTAVVILIVAGAFMWKFLVNRTILDGDGMERPPCDTITSCSYSCGGGMDGSFESLTSGSKENGEDPVTGPAFFFLFRLCGVVFSQDEFS